MTPPSRRDLLLTLAASGGTLLAGCAADPGTGGDQGDGNPDGPTVVGCPSTSPSSGTTDASASACPPFEDADRVVCYGETAPPESESVVMVPKRQSVEPTRSVEFTLRNQSDQTFSTNFYDWRLSKRVEGDWYRVAPLFVKQPLMEVPAGDAHTWTLTVADGDVAEGDRVDRAGGTGSITVEGVGGGQYAFGTDGYFRRDSGELRVGLAATFQIDADPLELVTTDAIESTRWDGDTLVARSTRYQPEGEDGPRDQFVLERFDCDTAESDPDANELVVEQVVRSEQIRDTVALSAEYDASRVRLEEYSRSTPAFARYEDFAFEFRGHRYKVTVRAGDES